MNKTYRELGLWAAIVAIQFWVLYGFTNYFIFAGLAVFSNAVQGYSIYKLRKG